jgi:superoxide dismutase, Cu-Zn family
MPGVYFHVSLIWIVLFSSFVVGKVFVIEGCIKIFNQNSIKMKSIFFSPKSLGIIVIIASIANFSCNNNGKTESTSDTTGMRTDTTNQKMTMDTVSVPMVNHAEARLSGTYADTIVEGSVKFDTESTGKVKMTLDITVPAKASKSVAVHIHEHGNCGDTAKMAHDHWNPTNAQHGKWGSASFHSGDIGNVKLNANGKGSFTLTTDLWTLGGKPDKNILDRSIIVHGGMDDYNTQPSGNSGTRIGCGVIQK